MDKNILKDRLLESENLTDELEDEDANWLINWGVKMLDLVLIDVTDQETAGENVNALMAVMRKINRICGNRRTKSAQDLALDLETLANLFSTAFNYDALPNPKECTLAAARLVNIETTAQALDFLTRWGRRPVFRM